MPKKGPDNNHREPDVDFDGIGSEIEASPEIPKYPFITLIVDDNDIVLKAYTRLCEAFTDESGEVIAVSTPEEAIKILEEAREIGEENEEVVRKRRKPLITLVIADRQFNNSTKLTGVDILRAAKKVGPFPPYTVSFTGGSDDKEFQDNSDAFLPKGSSGGARGASLEMTRIFKQTEGHFKQMMSLLPEGPHSHDGTPGYDGTKPTYFPRRRDELIVSNSNLRRYDNGKWVLSNIVAPPEILARAEQEASRVRSQIEGIVGSSESPESVRLLNELRYYTDVILKFGGNPDENIRKAYEVFNFPAYWFKDAFGNHDKAFNLDQMRHIAHELGFEKDGMEEIGRLKVLDVGTGGEARIIKTLHDLVRERDGNNLSRFRRSIRGFDHIRKVVHDARKSVRPLRINPSNIFQGNFLHLPSRYRKGQFHMITGMMHTPWHCDTEEKWTSFMRNMEQALAPGGRLIFDTVDIVDPHAIEDREKTFADFYSFYTVLWRYYCDKMQPIIDKLVGPMMDPKEGEYRPVPLLRKLNRHFVQDSTAGIKGVSYVREVPTKDFLTRICQDNGINLRLAITTTYDSEIKDNEELTRELGGRWISQNNLEGYIHYKIVDRIVRVRGRMPSVQEVREIYDDVQVGMARNYRNKYMSFKKDPK